MAQFQSGFQKYFLLIGVTGIFGVHYGMSRAHNYTQLQTQEREIAAQFKKFKIYKDGVRLPDIRVAGPRGEVVQLADTGGDYMVLNVWASWCTPCVKELPALKSLDKFLRREGNWRVVAVSIDTAQNLDKMARFTARLGVEDIANYNDYNLELQKIMNVRKLPTTFIISGSGDILYEIQGEAVWHNRETLNFLDLVAKVR